MIRSLAAVVLLGATLTAVRADGPDLKGNWLLKTVLPTGDSTSAIIGVEMKDGQPTATVVATPPRPQPPAGVRVQAEPPKLTVKSIKVKGDEVTLVVSQFADQTFVGTVSKDGKSVVGSLGMDGRYQRAKLTATDKDKLERTDTFTAGPQTAYTKATTAQNKPLLLQFQAQNEKDEEKKKALLAQISEARTAAATEVPKLYRQTVEESAETPAAYDAAMALLVGGSRMKVTAEEAEKLVAVVEKQAAPYGARFANAARLQMATALGREKAMAAVAVGVAEKAADALADTDPAALQVDVLTAYKTALNNTGKTDKLKDIDARLTKLETKLDQEYHSTVPPFKPTAFAGRKDKAANRVVVMELFTGAECPPCVAADVAFDALNKGYKPTDLILIQYHMHIPGPDPLTNPASEDRWKYYSKINPGKVRGTPTTLFNGDIQAGGGGGMANARMKYDQYKDIIDPLLEKTTAVKVDGKASRDGDQLTVTAEVSGADAKDELKLRFVLVEEDIKYVGGNKLRFHHQVVRALPGGGDGVEIKDAAFKHTATLDVSAQRKELVKYLDDYAANQRPFRNSNRPLDMSHLKVIALVQNDKTGEIVQAAQFDIGSKGS